MSTAVVGCIDVCQCKDSQKLRYLLISYNNHNFGAFYFWTRRNCKSSIQTNAKSTSFHNQCNIIQNNGYLLQVTCIINRINLNHHHHHHRHQGADIDSPVVRSFASHANMRVRPKAVTAYFRRSVADKIAVDVDTQVKPT